MASVLLAIPTAGQIHHRLVSPVVDMCKSNIHTVDLFISKMVGNEANRNAITEFFLEGDYEYLLMIDTDQEPLSDPLKLIGHDKDVVSMPTVINMGDSIPNFVWNVFDYEGGGGNIVSARKERGSGLENVYAVGTGCILIKRRVLEKIKNPFVPVRDRDDRRLVTQDIAFSIRCAEEGFDVWVDWDRILAHYKEINLTSL